MKPNIAEYHAKLAYALSKQDNPRLRREAFDPCKEAIKLDNENANYHALMGYLHVQVDDDDAAERHFRRALSWDPHHHKSREELKSIAFRSQQSKKENSLLTKIISVLKPKPKKPKRTPPAKRPRPETPRKS